MNWRNVQIFGMKELKIRRVYLILGVVLLGAFAWAFSFSQGDDRGSLVPSPTTLAVQNLPEEQDKNKAEEFVETVQDVVDTPSRLLRDYTRYPGQCAADLKNADDDLLDIQTYLAEFESLYERLKQDYDPQRASLDATYEPQLARVEKDIEKAQRDLAAAEARLDRILSSCGA